MTLYLMRGVGLIRNTMMSLGISRFLLTRSFGISNHTRLLFVSFMSLLIHDKNKDYLASVQVQYLRSTDRAYI
jgi:hypothetical protein